MNDVKQSSWLQNLSVQNLPYMLFTLVRVSAATTSCTICGGCGAITMANEAAGSSKSRRLGVASDKPGTTSKTVQKQKKP